MKLYLYKYWFCFCFSMLFLFTACSRPEIKSVSRPNDAVFSRQVWQRLVKVKSLKADAVLSWKAVTGDHGKYRVRLFLESPEKLKIQWLTPWGSVAGQLLIADQQFWLSDSRKHQTWHGQSADIEKLLSERGEPFQIVATRFFKFWPLLFSSPEVDTENFLEDIFIEYLSVGSKDSLTLTKTVFLPAGEEMQIRLFEMKELNDKQIMPEAVEILSRSGQVGITLRRYSLASTLASGTFIYSLKNFSFNEYL